MRGSLLRILIIVMLGLVQSSFFFDAISINGVAPDLLLIFIVFVGFKSGVMDGQTSGFAAGFMQQIFSTALFGLYAFSFTVVGFSIGMVQKKIYSDNFITAIFLVFFATLIKGLSIGFLAMFFGEVSDIFFHWIRNNLLIELIYNPLLAGPIFWLLNRMAILKDK